MNCMHRALTVAFLAILTSGPVRAQSSDGDSATYRVRQTVRLSGIGDDAGLVRWWIAIPDECPEQEVLGFDVVRAPGAWEVARDRVENNRFLYVEVAKPGKRDLETVVEFVLERRAVHVDLEPRRSRALSAAERRLFAASLRRDAPHMEVTETIENIANEVCGDETNVAVQVRKLLDHVADRADHYSKDPTRPRCGVGDAGNCLDNGGGCCTDLHSLFIALARARGIPARLQMGYRLLERNAGKVVDPGYRCWVESFVPGHGWVPADIVEADAAAGLGRAMWFSGLTNRRLWLNQGRDFDFSPRTKARVNHMSIAYAEIDGRPARLLPEGDLAPQISRTVRFEEIGGQERRDGATGAAPSRSAKAKN